MKSVYQVIFTKDKKGEYLVEVPDCDEHVNDFIQSLYSITSDGDFVLLIEEPKIGDYVVRQIRGSLIV